MAALLLISAIAVGGVLSLGEESGGDPTSMGRTPEDGTLPAEPSPSESEQANAGNGSGGEDGGNSGGDEGGDDSGEPPSYDEMETFQSHWFDVDHPAGWQVDDTEIDNTLAVFIAPGNDHQVWVTGWTEEEFTGTSAEYLEETNGGTNAPEDVTTDFTQLSLEEFEEDDYEEGWDVALVEADLSNETWTTPDRRFWAYAISMDYSGDRVFYLVSVNVPRADADYYEDLHEDVVETFDPHL